VPMNPSLHRSLAAAVHRPSRPRAAPPERRRRRRGPGQGAPHLPHLPPGRAAERSRHCLRHSSATSLAQLGVNPWRLQAWLRSQHDRADHEVRAPRGAAPSSNSAGGARGRPWCRGSGPACAHNAWS
jgi:hypothetical protein